ncbi:MAG: hypothetical protein IJG61_08410 [Lachnospiraceae bacterium]|nr:hypothetical protein [Lachnospiraceae bacterium]
MELFEKLKSGEPVDMMMRSTKYAYRYKYGDKYGDKYGYRYGGSYGQEHT